MIKLDSLFKRGKTEKEKEEVKKEESLFKIDFNAKKPDLPEINDNTKLDLRYSLILPYAYAHLYWDEVHGEIIYSIEEPNLDVREKEILNTLEQGVQELIDISFINVDDKEVLIEYLEKNIKVEERNFANSSNTIAHRHRCSCCSRHIRLGNDIHD